MNKRKYILLLAILAAAILCVDFVKRGPVSTRLFAFAMRQVNGVETVKLRIDSLSKPFTQKVQISLDEGEAVYKIIMRLVGETEKPILVNNLFQLDGIVDTVLVREWYSSTDFLQIEIDSANRGHLSIDYEFYYSK